MLSMDTTAKYQYLPEKAKTKEGHYLLSVTVAVSLEAELEEKQSWV